jgi:hypothetical protein
MRTRTPPPRPPSIVRLPSTYPSTVKTQHSHTPPQVLQAEVQRIADEEASRDTAEREIEEAVAKELKSDESVPDLPVEEVLFHSSPRHTTMQLRARAHTYTYTFTCFRLLLCIADMYYTVLHCIEPLLPLRLSALRPLSPHSQALALRTRRRRPSKCSRYHFCVRFLDLNFLSDVVSGYWM